MHEVIVSCLCLSDFLFINNIPSAKCIPFSDLCVWRPVLLRFLSKENEAGWKYKKGNSDYKSNYRKYFLSFVSFWKRFPIRVRQQKPRTEMTKQEATHGSKSIRGCQRVQSGKFLILFSLAEKEQEGEHKNENHNDEEAHLAPKILPNVVPIYDEYSN